ncbi:hypothetical protein NQ318_016730 [Aromia moschata]|uniref:Transposase n=1 Tax=Aromia moschata TaxID=1265417 RepID=A0AAV8XWF9_9CUCU|nr:hypothetical protein NQ318_016730 [Aromia moschata]
MTVIADIPYRRIKTYYSADDWLQRQNTNAGLSCSPISRNISRVAADISRYRNDDQKLDVMLMLEENPHRSSRQTASALNISHSSILRVGAWAGADLSLPKMHPYKLVPTNVLAKDDFDRRILFCGQMMQTIDDNTLQIENVLFSDESTFILHGHVNRQNCRYWSRENPHWMRELLRKTLRKLMFGQEYLEKILLVPSSLTSI